MDTQLPMNHQMKTFSSPLLHVNSHPRPLGQPKITSILYLWGQQVYRVYVVLYTVEHVWKSVSSGCFEEIRMYVHYVRSFASIFEPSG